MVCVNRTKTKVPPWFAVHVGSVVETDGAKIRKKNGNQALKNNKNPVLTHSQSCTAASACSLTYNCHKIDHIINENSWLFVFKFISHIIAIELTI